MNVCEQKLLTSQTGYIRSPNYPNSYPPSQKCELEVRLGVGQQVDLFAMDINLENGGNTTSDCIYLHDNFRSLTVCGHRYDEHIFKSYQNIVRLTFQSNENHQKKGFWLYYKGKQFMAIGRSTNKSSCLYRHLLKGFYVYLYA